MYSIDFSYLVELVTPTDLRLPKMLSWLKWLATPVVSIYNSFLDYKDVKDYELAHTSQVIYLEKLLNDRFDDTNRLIYIEDTIDVGVLSLYNFSEGIATVFRTYDEVSAVGVAIYNYDELLAGFAIFIPVALQPKAEELSAIVDIYKLAGIFYKLEYII